MIVRVHPKRFPLGTLKKFPAPRIGQYIVLKKYDSNAYEL